MHLSRLVVIRFLLTQESVAACEGARRSLALDVLMNLICKKLAQNNYMQ